MQSWWRATLREMNTISVGTKLNDWGKLPSYREKETCWAVLVSKHSAALLHYKTHWAYCEKVCQRKHRVTSQANQIKQSLSTLPTVIMATLIRLHSGHWFYVTLLLRWAHIDCDHSQPETFSPSLIHSVLLPPDLCHHPAQTHLICVDLIVSHWPISYIDTKIWI